MDKKKRNKSSIHHEQKLKSSLYFSFPLTEMQGIFIQVFLFLFACFSSYLYVLKSVNDNGAMGFPIDDAWIHLNFAKNLFEYGSYSYFKNLMQVSGSTSPLYTILLSAFYFISKNEFIISYITGILSFGLSTIIFLKIVKQEHPEENWYPYLLTVLFAIMPLMNLISVSGMETTLFVLFMLLVIYFYKTEKYLWFGVCLGLLIWIRPDGFIIWLAIAIDLGINLYLKNRVYKKNELIKSVSIALGIVALYGLFNLVLSGNILPATFNAKIEYYQNMNRQSYLKNDVWNVFTKNEYMFIWIPFLIAFVFLIYNLFKKKRTDTLIYFLIFAGFIITYYIKMPFTHRFGRYLLPVVAPYIIFSFTGLRLCLQNIQLKVKGNYKPLFNLIFIVLIISTAISEFIQADETRTIYSEYCNYHNARHKEAGLWISRNTNPDDVVATHDIGAIAFYGNRKVFDMAGLVSPEVAPHLKDQNFNSYLEQQFIKNNVKWVAVLKNWFEIVNDDPVYVPVNDPEFLEIYKFKPGKTHILNKKASVYNQAAVNAIQSNNFEAANKYLYSSLALDNKSSRTYFLLGIYYETVNDRVNAEVYYKKGLEIYPEYPELNFALGRFYYKFKNNSLAKQYLETALKYKQNMPEAQEILSKINKAN